MTYITRKNENTCARYRGGKSWLSEKGSGMSWTDGLNMPSESMKVMISPHFGIH